MADEWLLALAPLAETIISRIRTGQRVRSQEQMFVLLYTIAESTRETKEQMAKMSQDFSRLNDTLQGLSTVLSNLKSEVAYVRGRMDS